MPCPWMVRNMAKDNELRAARDWHDALVSEVAGLPAAISTAQSEVRVEDWMRLQNRAVELPGEIRRARLDVLPLELADAWAAAETAHAEETRLAESAVAAREAVDDIYADEPHRRRTDIEVAERHLTLINAKETQGAADKAYCEARDATCLALLRVDNIERELIALSGEPIQYGDGLRAAPRPLIVSAVASRREFGVLADRLDQVLPGPDDRTSRALLPGWTPPRWLTHRMGLGEQFFIAPATPAAVGPPPVARRKTNVVRDQRAERSQPPIDALTTEVVRRLDAGEDFVMTGMIAESLGLTEEQVAAASEALGVTR